MNWHRQGWPDLWKQIENSFAGDHGNHQPLQAYRSKHHQRFWWEEVRCRYLCIDACNKGSRPWLWLLWLQVFSRDASPWASAMLFRCKRLLRSLENVYVCVSVCLLMSDREATSTRLMPHCSSVYNWIIFGRKRMKADIFGTCGEDWWSIATSKGFKGWFLVSDALRAWLS